MAKDKNYIKIVDYLKSVPNKVQYVLYFQFLKFDLVNNKYIMNLIV